LPMIMREALYKLLKYKTIHLVSTLAHRSQSGE